jgi:hypothetical protein
VKTEKVEGGHFLPLHFSLQLSFSFISLLFLPSHVPSFVFSCSCSSFIRWDLFFRRHFLWHQMDLLGFFFGTETRRWLAKRAIIKFVSSSPSPFMAKEEEKDEHGAHSPHHMYAKYS